MERNDNVFLRKVARDYTMKAPNDYAIITSGLTKTYRSKKRNAEQHTLFSRQKSTTVTAIDRLNLKIRKGELFGLLGRNGAGKTTLVKVLCTLLPPDEGTATVNGT